MQILRLSEVVLDDGGHELRIEGELDLAVADQLQEALDGIDAERLLIDLAPCEFIDSTGIAIILRAQRRAQERGGDVIVHSPRAQVLRVLTVAGLTANGLIFETREQALASARQS